MSSVVWLILLVAMGGIAVGLQAPLVSLMTERLGLVESMFIVHLGGLAVIVTLLVARRGGGLGQWRSVPWYALISGVLGLVILTAISHAIPRVGVAATLTVVVASQVCLAVLLDHFGWMGAEVRRVDLPRLVGMGLMFLGVWLVMRK